MHAAEQRVLVVEDDDGNRLLVQRVLEEAGLRVVETSDGPSALRVLSESPIDVVVLDLGLPGLDGMDVLTQIRRSSQIPVLLLTARSDEHERVAGLDAGADDYLVKPYSVAELSARVRALLRRAGTTDPAVDRIIEHAELRIDLHAKRVAYRATDIDLTPREFGVLAFLAQHAPQTFSREALLHHVWGSMSEWQDQSTVTEHVRRIRAKLAAAGCTPCPIETVRGYGYRIEHFA